MSASTTLLHPTPTLVVGSHVMIHRNLDHPAWCQPIYGSPRDTGIRWLRQDGLPEELGVGEITAVRDRPSYRVVDGELVKVIRRELQVSDEFWYDAETLVQVGPDSTFLTPLAS